MISHLFNSVLELTYPSCDSAEMVKMTLDVDSEISPDKILRQIETKDRNLLV